MKISAKKKDSLLKGSNLFEMCYSVRVKERFMKSLLILLLNFTELFVLILLHKNATWKITIVLRTLVHMINISLLRF